MMKNYYLVIQGIKILPISILLVIMLFAPSYSYGQRDSVALHLKSALNSLSSTPIYSYYRPYDCDKYGGIGGRYRRICDDNVKVRINWSEDGFVEMKESILSAINSLRIMDCPDTIKKVEDALINLSSCRFKFQSVLGYYETLEEDPYWVWNERYKTENAIKKNYSEGMELLFLMRDDLRAALDLINECK